MLPREGRVLRDAPPAATLEALAGVAIGPEDLRTIVAGCGFAQASRDRAARPFDRRLGWRSMPVTTTTGCSRSTARGGSSRRAMRGPVEVRYADFASGRPATIRLRTLR